VLTKVDHLGIAVRDLDEALATYAQAFALRVDHREIIDDQGVEAVALRVGESAVELLQPTRDDSPIARFLAERGPGIHHVAYAVDDIEAALVTLRSQGVRLIDERPRIGLGGKRIAFIHPKSTFGVLTELVEPAESAPIPLREECP
jgi:methylmalonyl-CoA/ethylmalonyl-CoA epimerase